MKVGAWTGKESITIQEIVDKLNEFMPVDKDALQELMSTRVPCNKAMLDHESIQCHAYGDASPENPRVGFLGILNGILGTNSEGAGPIAMIVDNDGKTLSGFTTVQLKKD